MSDDALENGVEGLLARGMFELVPFNIAVIDREFRVPPGVKRPLWRDPAEGESDSRKRGEKGLGMIPSSFFRKGGKRWPNFPSKKKIE